MDGVDATLITAPGDGVAPAVLLSVGGDKGPQYLFNLPEGFSRLALEHRVRPGPQLRAIFATSLLAPATGGLAGLVMRLRQDGHAKVAVAGPCGLAAQAHALRHIISWRHPRLLLQDCVPWQHSIIYQDGSVEVAALWEPALSWQPPPWLTHPQPAPQQPATASSPAPDSSELSSNSGGSNSSSSSSSGESESHSGSVDHNSSDMVHILGVDGGTQQPPQPLDTPGPDAHESSSDSSSGGDTDTDQGAGMLDEPDVPATAVFGALDALFARRAGRDSLRLGAMQLLQKGKAPMSSAVPPVQPAAAYNGKPQQPKRAAQSVNKPATQQPNGTAAEEQGYERMQEDSNPVFHKARPWSTAAGGRMEKHILAFLCHIRAGDQLLAVVDCPSPASLPKLRSHPAFQHLTAQQSRVAMVLHLTRSQIASTAAYCKWLKSLPGKQVLVDARAGTGGAAALGFQASARTLAKLSLISPRVFPLPSGLLTAAATAGAAARPAANTSSSNVIHGQLLMQITATAGQPAVIQSESSLPAVSPGEVQAELQEAKPGLQGLIDLLQQTAPSLRESPLPLDPRKARRWRQRHPMPLLTHSLPPQPPPAQLACGGHTDTPQGLLGSSSQTPKQASGANGHAGRTKAQQQQQQQQWSQPLLWQQPQQWQAGNPLQQPGMGWPGAILPALAQGGALDMNQLVVVPMHMLLSAAAGMALAGAPGRAGVPPPRPPPGNPPPQPAAGLLQHQHSLGKRKADCGILGVEGKRACSLQACCASGASNQTAAGLLRSRILAADAATVRPSQSMRTEAAGPLDEEIQLPEESSEGDDGTAGDGEDAHPEQQPAAIEADVAPDAGFGAAQQAAESAPRPAVGSVPACLAALRDSGDDSEVVLLGTGCAEPSKYRGGSAIHLRLGCGGGLLLDAGEGALGQLSRRYGAAGAAAQVAALAAVWVSHRHADHVLGLPALIAARGSPKAPLLVVGPSQRCCGTPCRVGSWLAEVAPTLQLQRSYAFVHCRDFNAPTRPDHQWLLTSLGLTQFESVRVEHCHDAWGLVLEAAAGWRLVFSGDTRPCRRLAQAGRGATLLIHEATFEPGMHHQAVQKRHSTTGEALQAAAEMGAYRTVLTHFSQRYPNTPTGIPTSGTVAGQVLTAFDGMSLPLALLPEAPLLMPAISQALGKEDQAL